MSLPVAALLAGLVAILATVAVERFGGRLGGVLATVPSTIVPASLGMWSVVGPEGFDRAMAITPAAMWANALFLWSWKVIPAHRPGSFGLPALVSATLTVWCAVAASVVVLVQSVLATGYPASGVHHVLSGLLVGTGILATWKAVPAPRGKRPVSTAVLAARGVLAALAVAAALVLARALGPLVGGVFSVFPAIFLTAMVSLHASQGESVQVGAIGPMMLGTSSVAVYSALAPVAFAAMGPTLGATLAWTGSVLFGSLPAALWLGWRSRNGP